MLIRACISCGCTDDNACRGGCHWVHEADNAPLGICSICAPNIDVEELEAADFEWTLKYGEDQDAPAGLLLPGDPEYHATLRGGDR